MEKIICDNCQEELGERNEAEVYPNLGVNISIENGIIYFICRCSKQVEIGKSSDIKQLFKPGSKRIF